MASTVELPVHAAANTRSCQSAHLECLHRATTSAAHWEKCHRRLVVQSGAHELLPPRPPTLFNATVCARKSSIFGNEDAFGAGMKPLATKKAR